MGWDYGMKVKRIVSNIFTRDITVAKSFYQDVLGLERLMDHGWIANVDSAFERVKSAGFMTEYGPVDEPWGVRFIPLFAFWHFDYIEKEKASNSFHIKEFDT